jgi:hypothetical protein
MSMHQGPMNELGAELLQICSDARSDVLLAAPFVKSAALGRVLGVVDSAVQITLVTRWRVEEIHAGVSDLETWDMLEARGNSRLFLLPSLHAKYYRADSRCWIGSANLTQKALGWAARPNVELMIELQRTTKRFEDFERTLLEQSFPASQSLVEEVRRLLESLPPIEFAPLTLPEGIEAAEPDQLWMPALRHPEQLYLAYSGDEERLTAVSRSAALRDLAQLQPPNGLTEREFNTVVASALVQTETVRFIDGFLSEPRRFGAVTRHLRAQLPGLTSSDVDHAWQTLMRWLLHFLPDRYQVSVPNYSEVIRRLR